MAGSRDSAAVEGRRRRRQEVEGGDGGKRGFFAFERWWPWPAVRSARFLLAFISGRVKDGSPSPM